MNVTIAQLNSSIVMYINHASKYHTQVQIFLAKCYTVLRRFVTKNKHGSSNEHQSDASVQEEELPSCRAGWRSSWCTAGGVRGSQRRWDDRRRVGRPKKVGAAGCRGRRPRARTREEAAVSETADDGRDAASAARPTAGLVAGGRWRRCGGGAGIG